MIRGWGEIWGGGGIIWGDGAGAKKNWGEGLMDGLVLIPLGDLTNLR